MDLAAGFSLMAIQSVFHNLARVVIVTLRPWIVFVRRDFESIEWGFYGVEL